MLLESRCSRKNKIDILVSCLRLSELREFFCLKLSFQAADEWFSIFLEYSQNYLIVLGLSDSSKNDVLFKIRSKQKLQKYRARERHKMENWRTDLKSVL